MPSKRSLRAIDFRPFIEEHRELLKPPVGNRQIWEDGELIAMVIGGPNQRTDYHDDPSEEFFYQIEGDMVLRVMEEAGKPPVDVPIRAGEIFLLPPHVRHSPQRAVPGSIGLVIEAPRPPGAKDGSEHPPSHYLDRFLVDSAVFDERALRFLVEVLGEDRIVLGSDYPFPLGEERVGSLIRGSRFPPKLQEKILGANAESFVGLTKHAARSNGSLRP